MKTLFVRNNFPQAPGGNGYLWKEAETKIYLPVKGRYVIRVSASAQSSRQGNSTDDDDLRMVLDGYEFGKYEMHDEEMSWQGFNTASAWNGAALKGGTKIVYFFVDLQEGNHILTFYTDKKPQLHEISILQLDLNEKFEVEERRPAHPIQANSKGIPWMSFIFLGTKPKKCLIAAAVKSASQKKTTDGDNLKVFVNGKVVKNPKAPTSDKYKNFYFSGDLNKGKSELLDVDPKEFDFIEDSVDLWYDCEPSVYVQIELFDSVAEWADTGILVEEGLHRLKAIFDGTVHVLSAFGMKHSSNLLKYALGVDPQKLTYSPTSPLTHDVKNDVAYVRIRSLIQERIGAGVFVGQITPNDIGFETADLKYAVHGIKKIHFEASLATPGKYSVKISLFDVYDFDRRDYNFELIAIPVNMANRLEEAGLLKDFEIEIQIVDTITLNNVQ